MTEDEKALRKAARNELYIQQAAQDGYLGPDALFIRKRSKLNERLYRTRKDARRSRLENWTTKMRRLGLIVDSTETAYKDTPGGLVEVHTFKEEEAGKYYEGDKIRVMSSEGEDVTPQPPETNKG